MSKILEDAGITSTHPMDAVNAPDMEHVENSQSPIDVVDKDSIQMDGTILHEQRERAKVEERNRYVVYSPLYKDSAKQDDNFPRRNFDLCSF